MGVGGMGGRKPGQSKRGFLRPERSDPGLWYIWDGLRYKAVQAPLEEAGFVSSLAQSDLQTWSVWKANGAFLLAEELFVRGGGGVQKFRVARDS